MLLMILSIICFSSNTYICCNVCRQSWRVPGRTQRFAIHLPKMSHTCYIGLRSSEAGASITNYFRFTTTILLTFSSLIFFKKYHRNQNLHQFRANTIVGILLALRILSQLHQKTFSISRLISIGFIGCQLLDFHK